MWQESSAKFIATFFRGSNFELKKVGGKLLGSKTLLLTDWIVQCSNLMFNLELSYLPTIVPFLY